MSAGERAGAFIATCAAGRHGVGAGAEAVFCGGGGDSDRCAELTNLAVPSSSQTRRALQELSIGRLLRSTGAMDQSW